MNLILRLKIDHAFNNNGSVNIMFNYRGKIKLQ